MAGKSPFFFGRAPQNATERMFRCTVPQRQRIGRRKAVLHAKRDTQGLGTGFLNRSHNRVGLL